MQKINTDFKNNIQNKEEKLIDDILEIEKYKYAITRLLLNNISASKHKQELGENIGKILAKILIALAGLVIPHLGDLLSNLVMEMVDLKIVNNSAKQAAKIEKIIDKKIKEFNKKNKTNLKTIESYFKELQEEYKNNFKPKEFKKIKGYVQENVQALLLDQHENKLKQQDSRLEIQENKLKIQENKINNIETDFKDLKEQLTTINKNKQVASKNSLQQQEQILSNFMKDMSHEIVVNKNFLSPNFIM